MVTDFSNYFEIVYKSRIKYYKRFRFRFMKFQQTYKFFFSDMIF